MWSWAWPTPKDAATTQFAEKQTKSHCIAGTTRYTKRYRQWSGRRSVGSARPSADVGGLQIALVYASSDVRTIQNTLSLTTVVRNVGES